MNVEKFWSLVDKSGECWTWSGCATEQGYGQLRLEGKAWRAHRLAWTLVNGAIPEGMFLCHRCDNPSCVRPDHLFLGTNRDNMLDAAAKSRLGTLSVEDVVEIRRRANSGDTYVAIATDFGVARATVSKAAIGKNWAHVRGNVSGPRVRGGAKVTFGQVREIRRSASAGEPRRGLAAEFGMTKENIGMIVRGETWQEHGTDEDLAAEHHRAEGDDAMAEERAETERAWREGTF